LIYTSQVSRLCIFLPKYQKWCVKILEQFTKTIHALGHQKPMNPETAKYSRSLLIVLLPLPENAEPTTISKLKARFMPLTHQRLISV